MRVREYAKALDIWGIIKKYINFDEELAVAESWLHLEYTQEGVSSYVEVSYYKWETIPLSIVEEEPSTIRFSLTQDDTEKMYRELSDLVELPDAMISLHAHLREDNVVQFEFLMVPLLRN